jgi:hypothetical protein
MNVRLGSELVSPHQPRSRIGDDQRVAPVLLVAAWGALLLNVLAFAGTSLLLPIPRPLGQLVTQGALPLALVLVLVANRRGVIVPNGFLVLLSLLAGVALMVGIHNEYLMSAGYRTCRFVGFVVVLWLFTPWFGRRDMVLLRCHRLGLGAILVSVGLGVVVAPGSAFAFEGRLSGILWPIPPTQVAHYAAVMVGTTVVLWMCRVITTRHAMLIVPVTVAILIATHTRTAIMAACIGLVVAGASLFLGHARVRRASAVGAALGVLVAVIFASQVTTWALRGQSSTEAGELTGRTKVWDQVFAIDRSPLGNLFGSGMSNMSFNGLPIDSNWVATYLDAGWFGIVVEATLLLWLLLLAVTHVRGPHRAVALFLIVYCLVASLTETGLSAPSPYYLDLTVAAAMLAPGIRGRAR